MRQYKLEKMAKFMEIMSINPKLKQSEIAKELKRPTSTLQRDRGKLNMLSTYRISPSSKTHHKRKQKTPNTSLDDDKVTSKDLEKISNDLKKISNEPVETYFKKKTKRKRVQVLKLTINV